MSVAVAIVASRAPGRWVVGRLDHDEDIHTCPHDRQSPEAGRYLGISERRDFPFARDLD